MIGDIALALTGANMVNSLNLRPARLLEASAALVLMFALYPLFIFVMAAAYTPGRPLLRERYVRGAGGKQILLYEFNAPDPWVSSDPIHIFIHRSRADLLPRLINVLRGEVGLWGAPDKLGLFDDVHLADGVVMQPQRLSPQRARAAGD